MMNFSKDLSRHLFRGFSTTAVKRIDSLVKLKKLQADFQAETGQPVWLKGGLCDRILAGITAFACFNGILMTLAAIYDNAKPTSWKKRHTC